MHLHPAPLAHTLTQFRQGNFSLHAYLDTMCDRIGRVDGQVQSLLPEPDRRERLHAEAERLQARYPNPEKRPALYGALVGVKDIFHVQGFVTHAGSALPPESFAPESFAGEEAACVQLLRSAGALILGKTVTTEFAYFEPGPTRNPHNLEHTPGGSSSGSAAATAAGLCTLALGTQTIGSVIRPAAFCGVVGFKPTYDRIPSAGLVYFSRTADHVGLFTQDAAGMQVAAAALLTDWRTELGTLPRPVLGVPMGPYLAQTTRDAMLAFERQVQRLAWAGYKVVRLPVLADIQALNLLHRRMCFAEFAQEHADRYAKFADLYRPRTREIIETGKTVGQEELAAARANCTALRQQIESQMDAAGIDLWVSPPAPGPAPYGIHATGDPSLNLPWTHVGMPALTLPAGGAENGLPLGVQFVGRFNADEELLAWGIELAKKVQ